MTDVASLKAEVARLQKELQEKKGRAYVDQLDAIGRTPLVQLNRVTEGCYAKVYAKIEGRNPAYSVKCRIGAAMIQAAEKAGQLPGKIIVEPTSGNTGIALAYAAAARGHKLLLTMPETMTKERIKIMQILGAQMYLTEGSKGMKGAIAKAEELVKSDPDKYFIPDQFANEANPQIHFDTTGPEIWEATDGEIDVFVGGVGTGGTVTGISRYIKLSKGKKIQTVCVEPAKSPIITQTRAGQELKPGPHKIFGIGAGFLPKNLDLSMVDDVELVTEEESIEMAHSLGLKEGILCGISSGSAAAVAVRLARKEENKGKTIVCVLPDLSERYLSSVLYTDIPDVPPAPTL